MKKTFAFLAAVAMTLAITASAKTSMVMFNRYQFQPFEYTCEHDFAGIDRVLLTVPFVYKGTLTRTNYFKTELLEKGEPKFERWNSCVGVTTTLNARGDAVVKCEGTSAPTDHPCYIIDSNKQTTPIFMTICQPCIDCFPCTNIERDSSVPLAPFTGDFYFCEAQPGIITRWNLYYFDKDSDGNDFFRKIDLADAALNDVVFFTGAKGTGKAYVQLNPLNLFLSGKKSNYTFKFTEAFLTATLDWVSDSKKFKTDTAYVKSLASLAGATVVSDFNNGLDDTGAVIQDVDDDGIDDPYVRIITYKLTRDAALTKKALNDTFTVEFAKKPKGWEDCNYDIPATVCEEYFAADVVVTNAKNDAKIYTEKGKKYIKGYTFQDKFDNYLAEKYGYRFITNELTDPDLFAEEIGSDVDDKFKTLVDDSSSKL